ncbi:MAG: sugar transferase [Bacteroidales bacterium]|jgi:exopolysaccharide biosynthesis polyprenyl glycosylphosphotransferase|nr:sugar transferase [Bacteroidales bacterium]
MKNTFRKNKQIVNAVLLDTFVSMLGWLCFFSYRKFTELSSMSMQETAHLIFNDPKFYIGIVGIPLCWIILFAIGGSYNQIWKKSRLKEILTVFQHVLFGSLILFFLIILDDVISSYLDYIRLFLVLFCIQFFFIVLVRIVHITSLQRRIRDGKIQFNTLIVGTKEVIGKLSETLFDPKKSFGNNFVGYISTEEMTEYPNAGKLLCLGSYKDINQLVQTYEVEEIIIACDSQTRKMMEKILPLVGENNILLKILPTTEDHMLRAVKNTAIFHEPYIQIYLDSLPLWQKICKRIMDIVVSFLFMVLFSPLYLSLAIGVRRSSKGSILYRQERIGKKGRPFHIIKFRSMYEDAESAGPQLSSKTDSRITPFGLFMRRLHLDEIPQFYNVLKGDMSLVGPRPERQYYIDRIVERVPYYRLLLLEKPGITSWGQISYGYAENVDEMIERMRYDIMYIENMSLLIDMKILFYTVIAVLKRDGK